MVSQVQILFYLGMSKLSVESIKRSGPSNKVTPVKFSGRLEYLQHIHSSHY